MPVVYIYLIGMSVWMGIGYRIGRQCQSKMTQTLAIMHSDHNQIKSFFAMCLLSKMYSF